MLSRLLNYGRMIKFGHTVFALPFAFAGAALAFADFPDFRDPIKLLWITLAMIGARSAAMGFNRLMDRHIDASNPRTSMRELPAGKISARHTAIFVVFFVLLFITSAFMLNKLAFYLSPVALLVILGYSLTKRFTSYTHFVLGLGLGLAPLGAWIAITGQFNMLPVVLAAGVLLWVAGFDIIYACQDYDYDRNHQLFSLPVRIGLKNALLLTRILHLLAIILFVWVGLLFAAHIVYYIGMLIIFGLLLWEHSIIRADDLTRIDMAFFNLNGTVSIIYLLTVLFALYLEH